MTWLGLGFCIPEYLFGPDLISSLMASLLIVALAVRFAVLWLVEKIGDDGSILPPVLHKCGIPWLCRIILGFYYWILLI
jgi:hypothetical protein